MMVVAMADLEARVGDLWHRVDEIFWRLELVTTRLTKSVVEIHSEGSEHADGKLPFQCSFWKQGACKKGDSCPMHDSSAPRKRRRKRRKSKKQRRIEGKHKNAPPPDGYLSIL